jgi:hypothetical protein
MQKSDRQLVRNLRLRDEAAARLIPGFNERWTISGPDWLGMCSASAPPDGAPVLFRRKADGTYVLWPVEDQQG